MDSEKALSGLHADWDWLLKYYEARLEARNGDAPCSFSHVGRDLAVFHESCWSLFCIRGKWSSWKAVTLLNFRRVDRLSDNHVAAQLLVIGMH